MDVVSTNTGFGGGREAGEEQRVYGGRGEKKNMLTRCGFYKKTAMMVESTLAKQ